MNNNITIVCGVLPNSGDGLQQHDLRTLKLQHPNAKVKHTDIIPHISNKIVMPLHGS